MTRTVFFDAGHTLLHAVPSVPEIYAREARRFGSTVTGEEIAAAWPPIWREFTRRYAENPAHGAASEAQDRAMWHTMVGQLHQAVGPLREIAFEPWFDRLYTLFGTAEVWQLYDDTMPTLEGLKAEGVRIAVVSNWDARLRRIASELGLDRYVEEYVISAECGARKPDRRIFDCALERVGARPEKTLHIGDLYDEDIVGATRAGIRAILLDRHGHGRPDHASDSVEVVRRLTEILGR